MWPPSFRPVPSCIASTDSTRSLKSCSACKTHCDSAHAAMAKALHVLTSRHRQIRQVPNTSKVADTLVLNLHTLLAKADDVFCMITGRMHSGVILHNTPAVCWLSPAPVGSGALQQWCCHCLAQRPCTGSSPGTNSWQVLSLSQNPGHAAAVPSPGLTWQSGP